MKKTEATAKKLNLVTLTGADERTDLDRLARIVEANPIIEVGLLYTATPEGRNRYPTLEWLNRAAERFTGRCAIHVCGSGARKQLLNGELRDLIGKARRVQVNGLVTGEELPRLAHRVPILITQHNERNQSLADNLSEPNHQLLVDGSGGQGKSPEAWERPRTSKRVGFAGGLSAENIRKELGRIAKVATGKWWIDLEGTLRSGTPGADDWFNLDRCEAFLDQTYLAIRELSLESDAESIPGQARTAQTAAA